MVQYPNYKIENPQPLQHQNQCLFWIHHAQLPQMAHQQIGMEFQEFEENGLTLLKVNITIACCSRQIFENINFSNFL